MKKTGRSLFASLTTLLLCMAMFIGSTFAWFTDTVSNTGNKIQAGTLDVDLLQRYNTMSDAQKAVVEGTPADKEFVSLDTEDLSAIGIFDYDKWEPGYTTVKVLKIANKGNLALKFNLQFIVKDEVKSPARLADVIDVYTKYKNGVVNTKLELPESFDEAFLLEKGYTKTPLSELIDDLDGAAHGFMPTSKQVAGGSTTVECAIVLHMREDVGNEYQNLKVGDSFDIKLNATQYTAEKDGFGSNQYDKDAEYESDTPTPEPVPEKDELGFYYNTIYSVDVPNNNYHIDHVRMFFTKYDFYSYKLALVELTMSNEKLIIPTYYSVEDNKLALSASGTSFEITFNDDESLSASTNFTEQNIVFPAPTEFNNGGVIGETGKEYLYFEDELVAYLGSESDLIIPNGFKSIGMYFSYLCATPDNVVSISIPSSINKINIESFGGFANLSSIVVDESNKTYDSRDNCKAVIEKNTNTLIIGCNKTIVPETVTSIGEQAFNSRDGLESINIPDAVTSIGDKAFFKCENLSTVSITDNSQLATIGEYAFQECFKIESINLPGTLISIGEQAFYADKGLKTITIPKSVTTIGEMAFHASKDLASVIFEQNSQLQTVKSGAFNSCEKLTSVTFEGVSYNTVSGITSAMTDAGITVESLAFTQGGLSN